MKILNLFAHAAETDFFAPYITSSVPAGFPSPADDYMDKRLDLNEHLIKHPAATFYCRVSGHSMKDVGIMDGDLLIVDRSLTPKQGDTVLALLNGEMTCKILDLHRRQLLAANKRFAPIPIPVGADFSVEGVVIHSITYHHVCTG